MSQPQNVNKQDQMTGFWLLIGWKLHAYPWKVNKQIGQEGYKIAALNLVEF